MEEQSDLDILDILINMYMNSTEIKHLGILCQRASYRNENVINYIKEMRSKYNI